MNHEIYERVGALVSSLSDAEREVLKRHLYSTLPEWQTKSKLGDLLNDLNQSLPLHSSSYSHKNYQMLENRILDSLLFDINLTRYGKYTKASAFLSLKKDTMKMRLLQQRGCLQRAFQLAESVKQQALNDEGYDEAIEALNLQLSMIGLQQNANEFKELTEQINHYEYCRSAKQKSLALLYELKVKKHHDMTENLDLFITNSIATLELYMDRIQCRTIEFIREYFIKENFEQERNWHEALYRVTCLYEKAESLPCNTPHFNFWELAFEQARLCLKTTDGQTATFLLSKCIAHIPPEDLTHQKSVSLAFDYYCQINKFDKALKVALDYERTRFYATQLNQVEHHHWNFLKSCASFRLGQKQQAKRFLDATREYEKVSMKQNLQVRFLKIMLAIDMQNYDLADHYMDAMRKLVSRNQWLPKLKEYHSDTFYYALFKLRSIGYNFTELYLKYPEVVDDLRKTHYKLKGLEVESYISHWDWVRQKNTINPKSNMRPDRMYAN